MAVANKTVDGEVLEVLRNATVDGNLVRLAPGQLDDALYVRVDYALKRIGGKWHRSSAAHRFDRDPSLALAEILGTGVAPPRNPDAFFSTPPAVARALIDLAEIPHCDRGALKILEPSAGEGAILDCFLAIRGRCDDIIAFESNETRHGRLRDKGYTAFLGDFLEAKPSDYPRFDRVVMNPPFAVQGNPTCYIDHIRHAATFLRVGGRLVSVAPVGFIHVLLNRKVESFRDWVTEYGFWEMLPDDAFESSGTGVRTCLVAIRKPELF